MVLGGKTSNVLVVDQGQLERCDTWNLERCDAMTDAELEEIWYAEVTHRLERGGYLESTELKAVKKWLWNALTCCYSCCDYATSWISIW